MTARATVPIMQYNGQTLRNGQDRSLQTSREYQIITGLRGNKNHCAVGAGHAPPATVYYNEYNGLVCRGGIYAARCCCPDITIYRANRTERSRPFPTNLPEICIFPNYTLPFCGNCNNTGWFVAAAGQFPLIRRGGQPRQKYDVTGNLHGRALLAPTAQGILALYGLTLQPQ